MPACLPNLFKSSSAFSRLIFARSICFIRKSRASWEASSFFSIFQRTNSSTKALTTFFDNFRSGDVKETPMSMEFLFGETSRLSSINFSRCCCLMASADISAGCSFSSSELMMVLRYVLILSINPGLPPPSNVSMTTGFSASSRVSMTRRASSLF